MTNSRGYLFAFLLVMLLGCGPSYHRGGSAVIVTAGHPQSFNVILVNNTPYVITPSINLDPLGYQYTTVFIYPYSSTTLYIGYLPRYISIGGYYNTYYYTNRYYYLDFDYYYYSDGITFYYN